MKLKKISNNFHALYNDTTGLTIYFSYETPIAFRLGDSLTIRENDWSNATGKHLNFIDDDKSKRIDGVEFLTALKVIQL